MIANAVTQRLGLIALTAVALASCAAPPRAATQAVAVRAPEELLGLPPEARLAHELARACETRDAMACGRLGSLYWSGHGVPRHRYHARSLWSYACDAGDVHSCVEAGQMLERNPLPSIKRDEVLGYWASACARGSGVACTHLGQIALTTDVDAPQPRRAAKWYSKGCDHGDQGGCHGLALLAFEGRGTARDVELGVLLIEGACAKQHGESCRQLATLVRQGLFVRADVARAAQL